MSTGKTFGDPNSKKRTTKGQNWNGPCSANCPVHNNDTTAAGIKKEFNFDAHFLPREKRIMPQQLYCAVRDLTDGVE